jgi:hypothetical protein
MAADAMQAKLINGRRPGSRAHEAFCSNDIACAA